MKKYLLVIILILFGVNLYSQSKKECKKLLKKEIKVEAFQGREFSDDFKKLMDCYFDPIDYQIFMGPKFDFTIVKSLIALMFIEKANSSKFEPITYDNLMSKLMEFKLDSSYLVVKETVTSYNDLVLRTVNYDNWYSDSLLLIKLNFDPLSITNIRKLVLEKSRSGITYTELFSQYNNDIFPIKEFGSDFVKSSSEVPSGKIKLIDGLKAYNNYEIAKQKAIQEKKPLLLYFTGHGSTNSREMENFVLADKEIQDIINLRYIFASFLVDDRTPMKQDQIRYSSALGRDLKYEGDIYAELEINEFKMNNQPLFVSIGLNGDTKMIAFTLDIETFKEFLTIK